MREDSQVAYGVIACQVGSETQVIEILRILYPDARFLTARQEKHHSHNGQKSKVVVIFLPGYIFFRADPDRVFSRVCAIPGVNRLLFEEDRDWHLVGRDREFADWLFRYDGVISFSKAYQEGQRIRIIDGPMKDMEGCIRRIDRRGRSGLVVLNVQDREVRVWLGFDLVEDAARAGDARCRISP